MPAPTLHASAAPCADSDTGKGLGLTIVKNAVENGGGEIHCRNRPSDGLEIRLNLPTAD